MAEGMGRELTRHQPKRPASPRALASLVQALLHGLSMQLAADPDAFDGEEMLHLCLEMLGNTLPVSKPRGTMTGRHRPPPRSGQARLGGDA